MRTTRSRRNYKGACLDDRSRLSGLASRGKTRPRGRKEEARGPLRVPEGAPGVGSPNRPSGHSGRAAGPSSRYPGPRCPLPYSTEDHPPGPFPSSPTRLGISGAPPFTFRSHFRRDFIMAKGVGRGPADGPRFFTPRLGSSPKASINFARFV
jgi:hypothetical protein